MIFPTLNFVHLINIKVSDNGVKASVKIVQKIHNLRKSQESTSFNQYEEVRTTTHLQGGTMRRHGREPHDVAEVDGCRAKGLCNNRLSRNQPTAYRSESAFHPCVVAFWHFHKYLLWKQLMQKTFSFVFLHQVVLGPLLDQVLEVVGVLLHPVQEALQDNAHGRTANNVYRVVLSELMSMIILIEFHDRVSQCCEIWSFHGLHVATSLDNTEKIFL